MRKKILPVLLLSFLMSVSFSQAHSAEVDVTDGPSLQAALTAAGHNNEPDTIRLAAGFYDASGGTFSYQASISNSVGAEENFPLTLMGPGDQSAVIDAGNADRGLIINTGLLLDDSNAAIQVEGLTFQHGTVGNNGGGLVLNTLLANVSILDCLFMNNSAGNNGGGLLVFSNSGQIVLEDNSFTDANSANNNGGGVAIFSFVDAPLIVTRNRFEENMADNTGGGFVYFSGSPGAPVTFTDNLFFNGNQAGNLGGGASFFLASGSGPLDLTNNTFTGNQAGSQGGGIFISVDGDDPVVNLFNNILWGNTATTPASNDILLFDDVDSNNAGAVINLFNNDFAALVSTCTDTPACTPNINEGNNQNLDPQFVDNDTDPRLLADSPLIDLGDPAAPGLPAVDFAGNPRITGPAPDMGAFENPQVDAAPADHDFGTVPVGQSGSVQLTLTNPNVQDLEFNLALSDDVNFTLNPNGGNNPCSSITPTIPAGAACTLELFFNPTSEIDFAALLTISGTDPTVLDFIVSLSGTGGSGGGGGGCSLSKASPSGWIGWASLFFLTGFLALRFGYSRD